MTPKDYDIKRIKEFREKFINNFPYLTIRHMIEGHSYPPNGIVVEPLELFKDRKDWNAFNYRINDKKSLEDYYRKYRLI